DTFDDETLYGGTGRKHSRDHPKVQVFCSKIQGFSEVATGFDCSRRRRSQGEEGAGLRPQPCTFLSTMARKRAVLSEKITFEKPRQKIQRHIVTIFSIFL